MATGPVHLEGGLSGGPIIATANMMIEPESGGIPIQGSVDAKYDGSRGTLSLGKSHLSAPGMQIDVSGVLGEQLDVQLVSTNPEDLLPAINAFSTEPIKTLPIQLKNGKATFDGTVSGKLSYPQVAGTVTVTNFVYSGIGFDRFGGQVTLNPSSASPAECGADARRRSGSNRRDGRSRRLETSTHQPHLGDRHAPWRRNYRAVEPGRPEANPGPGRARSLGARIGDCRKSSRQRRSHGHQGSRL